MIVPSKETEPKKTLQSMACKSNPLLKNSLDLDDGEMGPNWQGLFCFEKTVRFIREIGQNPTSLSNLLWCCN
jgi:hypothetical protein